MAELNRLIMGDISRAYLIQKLSVGSSLVRTFAENKFRVEEVFTFAPVEMHSALSAVTMDQMDWPLELDRAANLTGLLCFLLQELGSNSGKCCAIEDSAKCKSLVLSYEDNETNYSFYNEEVYHFLFPGDGVDVFSYAIEDAETPYILWGVIADDVFRQRPGQFYELESSDIKRLASSVQYIFTAAWDNEGYLIGKVVVEDAAAPKF